MFKIIVLRIAVFSALLLTSMFVQCRDSGTGPDNADLQLTRLYLAEDNKLSSSPTISLNKIYSVTESVEFKTVLACDMDGNTCNFGIVFAARPQGIVKVKAEIITCHNGTEKVIARKYFQVKPTAYTRYMDTLAIEDPQCSGNDILILRITKMNNDNARLSLIVGANEPFDSYVDVPKVRINN